MSERKLSFDDITRKTGRFNVRFRWLLICLFVLLSVISAVAIPFTEVIYDVSGYLPDESTAAQGLAVLKEDFDDKGNAYAVVKGISKNEAKTLAADLEKDTGVDKVIFEPSSSYNEETSSALITILFTDYDSTKEAFATMERIIDATEDYDVHFIGQSASSYYTKIQTERSILTVGIVIAAVIIIMLLVTSKTYFEIVPMLITLGVSVLLNMGTNYLFHGISYISNLVSIILQLALSIDYSVILMHRYTEERANGLSPVDAAVEAQRKGVPEILSSSLTTFAGMCALILMKLDIGVEIGISLAKGVVLSLITVLFLMPALLVIFARPLEATRHRDFLPSVAKPTRGIVRARKVIVPLFLVIMILAGVGQAFNTYSFDMNKTEMLLAGLQAVEDAGFGKMNTLVLVLPNDGDYAKQRAACAYVESFDSVESSNALASIELAEGIYLTDELDRDEFASTMMTLSEIDDTTLMGMIISGKIKEIFDDYCLEQSLDPLVDKPHIIDLLIYISDRSDEFAAAAEQYASIVGDFSLFSEEYLDMLSQLSYAKNNLTGENYVRMIFSLKVDVEDEAAFDLIEALETGLKDYYDEYYMTGESVVCHDMAGYFPTDNLRVNLFTIAFILIILLFTFRNLLLPVILTLTIQGTIWINCAIPFLAGYPVSFIGYLIICAIQMGATIDYAIVLTNRYYSIRDKYESRYQAMAEAMNAVFPTVVTSGVILTLTGFILYFASAGVVAAMGSLLGFGALFAMLVVLFILPSLLLVTEKIADKCSFKSIKERFSRKKKEANK